MKSDSRLEAILANSKAEINLSAFKAGNADSYFENGPSGSFDLFDSLLSTHPYRNTEQDCCSKTSSVFEWQDSDPAIFILHPRTETFDSTAFISPTETDFGFTPLDEDDLNLLIRKREASEPERVVAPDISKGLGANKKNLDIVSLYRFALKKRRFGFYHDELCIFENGCWHLLDEDACVIVLRALLQEHKLDDALTPSTYRQLYQMLKTSPSIQRYLERPSKPHLLNLKNGTLNLRTWRLFPHCLDDGFFNCFPFTYEEMMNAEGPVFERFIAQAGKNDPLILRQVLEAFLIMSTGLRVKSLISILGPSGTGKTQLGRAITGILGYDQVVTIRSMSDFKDKFALGGIEHKKVIMCLDLPDTPLPNAAIGMIKQLVGDDPIPSEQKYKNSVTVYNKPLFVCAGNHPIRLPNMSKEDALLRRMVIIPFMGAPDPEDVIPQLYEKLVSEAPYIIREAAMLYNDFVENGLKLTQANVPPEYRPCDSRTGYNGVSEFLQSYCIIDASAEVATSELYNAYRYYANELSIESLSPIEFSRLLSEAIANLKYPTKYTKHAYGTDQRGYKGISLRTDAEPHY